MNQLIIGAKEHHKLKNLSKIIMHLQRSAKSRLKAKFWGCGSWMYRHKEVVSWNRNFWKGLLSINTSKTFSHKINFFKIEIVTIEIDELIQRLKQDKWNKWRMNRLKNETTRTISQAKEAQTTSTVFNVSDILSVVEYEDQRSQEKWIYVPMQYIRSL